MSSTKYLTEARLFAPAANKWASDNNLMNVNGGLLVLQSGNNLSDLPSVNQARINLGLRIGTDVQAFSSNLTTWANAATPSPFTLSLISKESSTAWRTSIGAGTVSSVSVSGGNTGLLFTGGPILDSGTITLDGILSIEHGGTGTTTIAGLKVAIGLGNVDNTSDANKPISTATQSALNTKYNTPTGTVTQFVRGDGSLGEIADIGGGAPGSGTVTSVDISGGLTGLTFTGGPIVNNGIFSVSGTLNVTHGGTGVTSLSALKTALNLNNVDNTSDLSKPISTAVQVALDDKANNTTATVSVNGLMSASDKAKIDVIPSNATANDTDADLRNRSTHTGTQAISTVTNLQSTLDAKEPIIVAGNTSQYLRGDKTWQTLNKSTIGLSNVDDTSDANKPISNATQLSLDAKASLASVTAIQNTLEIYNTLFSISPVSILIDTESVGDIYTLTTTLPSPIWSKAYGSTGIDISASGIVSIETEMAEDTNISIVGRIETTGGLSTLFPVTIHCVEHIPDNALYSVIDGQPLTSAIDGDYILSALGG